MNGNLNTTYEFVLIISLPVFKNEYVKITPPSSVKIKSAKDQCKGLVNLSPVLSCSVNNQSLFVTITPVDATQTRLEAGSLLHFTVSNIENPPSLEPTSSFQIYLTSSLIAPHPSINQLTLGLSLANTLPNALKNVQIYPGT